MRLSYRQGLKSANQPSTGYWGPACRFESKKFCLVYPAMQGIEYRPSSIPTGTAYETQSGIRFSYPLGARTAKTLSYRRASRRCTTGCRRNNVWRRSWGGTHGYRESFSASAECMALLARIPDRLIDEIRVDYLGKCPSSAVDDVGRFLKDMLARIDRESIVERILEIDQDYLGIYEPGKIAGTIGIHWALIALCASRLGVSMEALSLKVLAHEYAHAFSHLGMDANGNHRRTVSLAYS